jgi:uncharacterized membrane protein
MEVRKISVVDAVNFAFRAIFEHIRLFVLVFLVGSGLIVLIVGIIGFFNLQLLSSLANTPMFQSIQECMGTRCLTIVYESGRPFIEFLFNNAIPLLISGIAASLFFIGLDFGFKAIALDVYDKNNAKLETLWSRFSLVLTGFIAWTLYCLMVWLGFMFFIIPGFFVLLRFGFFPFFIIDKNIGAIDSLKRSYEATQGHLWDIFAFWVVIKIIMYVGYLTYIGIILTWPVSTLAYAYIYRQLVPRI